MKVTIGLVSFDRPELLRETLRAIYRKPGEKFKFLMWSNSIDSRTKEVEQELQAEYGFELLGGTENIGQQAIRKLIDLTETEFFLMVEDDMIWFTDDWVKKMRQAMELVPDPAPVFGTKQEWGILTTNCLQDRVTNGALWPDHWLPGETISLAYQGIRYIVTRFAAGGPLMMRTKLAQELDAFTADCPTFDAEVDMALYRYRFAEYPVAHVRDVYTYHANSPFFNAPYLAGWAVKQGEQTIEEAYALYKEQDDRFEFEHPDNQLIWDYIKAGTFANYAEDLWQKTTK